MDNYIEVIGSSEYVEYPDKVILDIDITVRAAEKESAEKDIREVVNATINYLYENGLNSGEIFFEGRETYMPWWRRDKAGVETRNRISIKSSKKQAVYDALENIDRYKHNKRITFSIEERQPIYMPKEDEVAKAMQSAVQDALSNAQCLAEACNRNVGKVLKIEEVSKGMFGSGSCGDYDYGDGDALQLAIASGEKPQELNEKQTASRVERNTRLISLQYRVKCELV